MKGMNNTIQSIHLYLISLDKSSELKDWIKTWL